MSYITDRRVSNLIKPSLPSSFTTRTTCQYYSFIISISNVCNKYFKNAHTHTRASLFWSKESYIILSLLIHRFYFFLIIKFPCYLNNFWHLYFLRDMVRIMVQSLFPQGRSTTPTGLADDLNQSPSQSTEEKKTTCFLVLGIDKWCIGHPAFNLFSILTQLSCLITSY